MVAMLDSKGKSFFVTENTSVNAGATAIGLPVIAPCNEEAQINYSESLFFLFGNFFLKNFNI